MRALAALVAVSQASKDKVAAVAVPGASGSATLPLLHATLRTLLLSRDAGEQQAADAVLEAYCAGNATGQSVLASSVAQGAPPGTFGGDLLATLEGKAPFPVTPFESLEAGLTVMAIDQALDQRTMIDCGVMWAAYDAAVKGG